MLLLRSDGTLVCEMTNTRTFASAEGTVLEGDVPADTEIGDPTVELIVEYLGERQRFAVKGFRRRTPNPGSALAVAATRVRGVLR